MSGNHQARQRMVDVPEPALAVRVKPGAREGEEFEKGLGDVSLLHLHPEIRRRYADVDLRRLTPRRRREMLWDVERALGIPATWKDALVRTLDRLEERAATGIGDELGVIDEEVS